MVQHADLTGSELHEPKGVDTATAQQVYVADGASGGAWTSLKSAINTNINSVGIIQYTEVTVAASDLDSSGTKTIIDSSGTEQYKIREIILSAAGTNYAAGGDRDIAITDGTTTWTVIPNSVIESLAGGRWDSTEVPLPSTAAHINTASAAGTDIYAIYSGGTTDHSGTGSLTLIIGYERTA